jgi:hypothetical protein
MFVTKVPYPLRHAAESPSEPCDDLKVKHRHPLGSGEYHSLTVKIVSFHPVSSLCLALIVRHCGVNSTLSEWKHLLNEFNMAKLKVFPVPTTEGTGG